MASLTSFSFQTNPWPQVVFSRNHPRVLVVSLTRILEMYQPPILEGVQSLSHLLQIQKSPCLGHRIPSSGAPGGLVKIQAPRSSFADVHSEDWGGNGVLTTQWCHALGYARSWTQKGQHSSTYLEELKAYGALPSEQGHIRKVQDVRENSKGQ